MLLSVETARGTHSSSLSVCCARSHGDFRLCPPPLEKLASRYLFHAWVFYFSFSYPPTSRPFGLEKLYRSTQTFLRVLIKPEFKCENRLQCLTPFSLFDKQEACDFSLLRVLSLRLRNRILRLATVQTSFQFWEEQTHAFTKDLLKIQKACFQERKLGEGGRNQGRLRWQKECNCLPLKYIFSLAPEKCLGTLCFGYTLLQDFVQSHELLEKRVKVSEALAWVVASSVTGS